MVLLRSHLLRHVLCHLFVPLMMLLSKSILLHWFDNRLRLIGLCKIWPRPCRLPSSGFVYLLHLYYTRAPSAQQEEGGTSSGRVVQGVNQPVEVACPGHLSEGPATSRKGEPVELAGQSLTPILASVLAAWSWLVSTGASFSHLVCNRGEPVDWGQSDPRELDQL